MTSKFSRPQGFACIVIGLMFLAQVAQAEEEAATGENDNRPNIIWLSAEDIGPELGCYGDTMANTPVIDEFAKSAMRYKVAWSNYPVCAPARTTIITGSYACVGAAGNMRSSVPLPKDMVMFPSLLREAGYYCTNNSKEDYNYSRPKKNGKNKKNTKSAGDSVWDDSSKTAHYKNRAEGTTFLRGVQLHQDSRKQDTKSTAQSHHRSGQLDAATVLARRSRNS